MTDFMAKYTHVHHMVMMMQ